MGQDIVGYALKMLHKFKNRFQDDPYFKDCGLCENEDGTYVSNDEGKYHVNDAG